MKRYTTPKKENGEKRLLTPKAKYIITLKLKDTDKQTTRKRTYPVETMSHLETQKTPEPSSSTAPGDETTMPPAKKSQCKIM